MIVFAAHTPHTPLLLETVDKNSFEKIKKTREALQKLEESLYVSKPHIILVISPHTGIFDRAFTINAHTSFKANYKKLGDYMTQHEWQGIPYLASRIKEETVKKNLPIQLISDEKIDHGSSVPLTYLTQHLPNVSILPIGYAAGSPKDHISFGQAIKDVCMRSNKRIAIISTGDLSHALDSHAPAGYHKSGVEFDQKIIELLESHNTTGIATISPTVVKDAAEDGYRSLLILLGAIKNMNHTFKNLSYEHPFGVGYLTGEFDFA